MTSKGRRQLGEATRALKLRGRELKQGDPLWSALWPLSLRRNVFQITEGSKGKAWNQLYKKDQP